MAPAWSTALAVLVATLMLLVVESAARFRLDDSFAWYESWGHKRSIVFGFEARPDHHWENAAATYTTDSFGFRTHHSNPAWASSTATSIFTLGGSAVFGFGLNDDETWPHRLEERLRGQTRASEVVVVNAGNNGHNSLQTLLRFHLHVVPHEPDAVLYYQNINDVSPTLQQPDSVMIEEDILFTVTLADYLAKRNRNKNPYARMVLAHLVYPLLPERVRGPLGGFFGHRGFSSADGPEPRSDEVLKRNGARYLANVRALAELCELHAVPLVLVTFLHGEEHMDDYHSRGIRHHNQLLRGLAAERGLPLIDLEERFRSVGSRQTYFFEDSYHPSAAGAEFIAEEIAAALARHDWLP